LAELVDAARTLNSTIDAPALLARVSRMALARLGGDWSAALRIDLVRRTFRVAAIADASGTSSEPAGEEMPLASWAPLTSLAYARGAVLGEVDAKRTPEVLTRGRQLSSVLLAGLFRDEELFAALAVGHGTEHIDRHASLERLAELAEHASIALRNAQLLEEARQASALRSEFVSTVSHELRTPLNVIIGYAEMLKDAQGAMSTEHRQLLERMDTCSRELLDLVEATLQVGRLEAGCIDVEVERQPIPALVAALQAGTSGLPRPSAVAFEWDHQSATDGVIVTDRAKVALVVRNLVSNAFKFTRSGRVSVRLRPRQNALEIEVSDTGIGIPPEKLPLIFERFRTLRSAEPRASGVGLGLYIVDQLVKRLGGSITVESAPGSGTTFCVTLPGYARTVASRAA
jgi:signal transduction histidine kinase